MLGQLLRKRREPAGGKVKEAKFTFLASFESVGIIYV